MLSNAVRYYRQRRREANMPLPRLVLNTLSHNVTVGTEVRFLIAKGELALASKAGHSIEEEAIPLLSDSEDAVAEAPSQSHVTPVRRSRRIRKRRNLVKRMEASEDDGQGVLSDEEEETHSPQSRRTSGAAALPPPKKDEDVNDLVVRILCAQT
jgi:hypothetical protein